MMSIFDEYPTTPDVDITPLASVPAPPERFKVNVPPTPYSILPYSGPCVMPNFPLPSVQDTSDGDSFLHDLRKALCKSIPGVLTIVAKATTDYIFKTLLGGKSNQV